MKFTSQIIATANLLTPKYGRSMATKIAIRVHRDYSEYALTSGIETAIKMAANAVNCLNFGRKLNSEKRVFKVCFYAEKHKENIFRDAVSIGYAIETGLYKPVGGEKRGKNLLTYYDLTAGGVRAMKIHNFVEAE